MRTRSQKIFFCTCNTNSKKNKVKFYLKYFVNNYLKFISFFVYLILLFCSAFLRFLSFSPCATPRWCMDLSMKFLCIFFFGSVC